MFLKPEQQLERCKRIVRQRVDPHIHPSIAQLAVESFDIPGEPMPTDEFFAKLNRGDIDFKPFTLGSEWGTTWGTVWFRLTGTVPAGYPKGKPLELILDLGWYPHSCGGHIEGLVYRADGTAIKAVHPLNYWVPFIDAEGNAQVPVAEDGSFTLYEDEFDNYNYEKGAYTEIPMTWDDSSRRLTIGARRGSYPGMLTKRQFTVRTPDGKEKTVTYTGKKVTVRL